MKYTSAILSFIALFLLAKAPISAQVSISSARASGAGATVTVKGIAINGPELGVIRYIQDKNAGLSLYSGILSGVKPGDSIMVTGTLTNYSNLLEMTPVSSYTVISTNNPLPKPVVLPLNTAFSEVYEGMLVEIDGVTLDKTGTFQNKATYNASQNGNKGEVYVNTTSSLVGSNIPSGKINIIGIMGQYKNSYQLLPRFLSDIVQSGPSLLTDLIQTNIAKKSFTVGFQTQGTGNTIIRYGLTQKLELTPDSDNSPVTSHSIDLTGLAEATLYYVQGMSVDANGDTAKSAIRVFATASVSSGRMSVFFNNTIDTSVAIGGKYAHYAPNPDDSIVKYIDLAKISLDIAIYNFGSSLHADIAGAINNAYTRGVQVRIIADGSSNNAGINQLNKGIHIIKSPTSSAYTIMHNKFMIIDTQYPDPDVPYVWTGSTNWTSEQLYSDFNNVITIQDQVLAKAYELEFNEMWGSAGVLPNSSLSHFGKFKNDVAPHKIMSNGNLIELYFSPSDGTTGQIIKAINTADKECYFNAYVFTRTDIASAIAAKVNQNQVFAAGTIGDTAAGTSVYNILHNALGSKVEVYKGKYIFHHKYGIIDPHEPGSDPLVFTGSHNWSSAAEQSNDENIIIVHNYDIANLYYQEWLKRYHENGGTETYKYSRVEQSTSDMQSQFKFMGYKWNEGGCEIQTDFQALAPATTATVYLTDMNGRIIFKTSTEIVPGTSFIKLGTPNLAKGTYLLNINAQNINSSYKLIKM